RRRTAITARYPKRWEGLGGGASNWEGPQAKRTPMRLRIAALAATTLALAGAAPAAARTHYVVRYGDTLTGIAHAHGVGLRRLARANHRRVNGILRAGSVLVVPGRSAGGSTYTVSWGDT